MRKYQFGSHGADISLHDVTQIAIGRIISVILPPSETFMEHMAKALPYIEAVTRHLHNEKSDPSRVAELCAFASKLPRLQDCDWLCVPLEEHILFAVSNMHDIRRANHNFTWRDPEWFMCLPLAFIGWDKTKIYYDALSPFLSLLNIEIGYDLMQRMYYEHSAQIFHKYDLADTDDFYAAMQKVLAADPSITCLKAAERRLLCNRRFIQHRLQTQLIEAGCGRLSKIRALAAAFDGISMSSEQRPEVDQELWEIAIAY